LSMVRLAPSWGQRDRPGRTREPNRRPRSHRCPWRGKQCAESSADDSNAAQIARGDPDDPVAELRCEQSRDATVAVPFELDAGCPSSLNTVVGMREQ